MLLDVAGRTPRRPTTSRGARRYSKNRLLVVASAVTGILALTVAVAGATLGRFTTTTTSGSNTFAAGTVTLANSAIANCPVTGLLPNNTTSSCTFTTSYSGSVPVYLAVDVLIETQAGSGGTNLYKPADAANDLQVTITSSNPTVTYSVPTVTTTCPGGASAGSACYELDNDLVTTSSVTSASVTFTITAKLTVSSTTGYQGGTAQIILTTHAAQATNNALSCSATPTAGSPCTPSGSFKWS